MAVLAARVAQLRSRPEAVWVSLTIVVTLAVMFLGIGERFSATDLSRIRNAESELATACRGSVDRPRAMQDLATLAVFFRRDPDQPLPLRGAGPASSMRSELSQLRKSLPATACGRDAALRSTLDHVISSR